MQNENSQYYEKYREKCVKLDEENKNLINELSILENTIKGLQEKNKNLTNQLDTSL